MDINMNWDRLKDMRCPDCGAILINKQDDSHIRCCLCNFKIRHLRFEEIINGMYKPEVEVRERDNLSELINL